MPETRQQSLHQLPGSRIFSLKSLTPKPVQKSILIRENVIPRTNEKCNEARSERSLKLRQIARRAKPTKVGNTGSNKKKSLNVYVSQRVLQTGTLVLLHNRVTYRHGCSSGITIYILYNLLE